MDLGAGKMTYRVELSAVEPGDLRSIPWSHLLEDDEGRELTPTGFSLTSTRMLWHACLWALAYVLTHAPTHTHKEINVIK